MAKVTFANALGIAAAAKSFLQPSTTRTDNTNKMSQFIATMRSSSVARTNLFEIVFTAPRILATNPTKSILSLYACDGNLPGVFLQTFDVKRYGTGPNEKLPYSTEFNDITFSFIGDGQGDIYKFFYNWIQGIVSSDVHMTNTNASSVNQMGPYEVNFKEDYRTTINIITYDENRKVILNYQLMEAYPIWLGDSPLSWGDTDNLQKFPITFTFMQAKLENVDDQKRNLGANGPRPLSPFEKLYKIGTIGQTIYSMRKPNSIGDVINVVSNAKIVLKGLGGVI